MINRNRLTPKMLGELEAFEETYSKKLGKAIGLYIIGAVPLIITSALATSMIIDLGVKRKKFKDASK